MLVVNGILVGGGGCRRFLLLQNFCHSPGLYAAKKFSCVGEELFVLEAKEVNVPLKEG